MLARPRANDSVFPFGRMPSRAGLPAVFAGAVAACLAGPVRAGAEDPHYELPFGSVVFASDPSGAVGIASVAGRPVVFVDQGSYRPDPAYPVRAYYARHAGERVVHSVTMVLAYPDADARLAADPQASVDRDVCVAFTPRGLRDCREMFEEEIEDLAAVCAAHRLPAEAGGRDAAALARLEDDCAREAEGRFATSILRVPELSGGRSASAK